MAKLITPELIDSLEICCRMYKCNDGLVYGYWIILKKGKDIWSTSLDMDKITPERCDYPQFIEAIRIFNEIIEATNLK